MDLTNFLLPWFKHVLALSMFTASNFLELATCQKTSRKAVVANSAMSFGTPQIFSRNSRLGLAAQTS